VPANSRTIRATVTILKAGITDLNKKVRNRQKSPGLPPESSFLQRSANASLAGPDSQSRYKVKGWPKPDPVAVEEVGLNLVAMRGSLKGCKSLTIDPNCQQNELASSAAAQPCAGARSRCNRLSHQGLRSGRQCRFIEGPRCRPPLELEPR
jgi:hypothetical protein